MIFGRLYFKSGNMLPKMRKDEKVDIWQSCHEKVL